MRTFLWASPVDIVCLSQMMEATAHLVLKMKPVENPFVTDPGTACAGAKGVDTAAILCCLPYALSHASFATPAMTNQRICQTWCGDTMMTYATGFSQEELLHQAYRMRCWSISDAGRCSGLKGSSLGLNPGQHISMWTLNSALVLLPGFCVLFLHCSQQVAKLRRSFEHYQHLNAAEHGAQLNSACHCTESMVLGARLVHCDVW